MTLRDDDLIGRCELDVSILGATSTTIAKKYGRDLHIMY